MDEADAAEARAPDEGDPAVVPRAAEVAAADVAGEADKTPPPHLGEARN